MRQVMVRYKVKPDRVEENEQLVRAVYEELAATGAPALRYATFRLDDGVSFVHIATVADESNPLAEVAAFARFQADVRDRCEEPPVVTELHEVGSYRP
jgi:quinol monooxygenase YgiN